MKKNAWFKLLWIFLGLLAIASIAQGFMNGLRFIDFHWESAALFLRGENPYQWFFDDKLYQGVYVDATQAPSTIAFILPYGIFNHFVGNALWAVSNVVFVLVFLYFLKKTWLADRPMLAGVVAVIFLLGTPFRNCIGNGQHTLFSFAFFMMAYYAMERKWSKWLLGLLMAASLFKYTVTVPMAFIFLFRREWKAMFTCAGIHIGLTVLLGLWTGCNPVSLVLQSMQIGTCLNASGGDADLAGLLSVLGAANVKSVALFGYAVWGLFLLIYSFSGRKDSLLKLATISIVANVMFYHRVYDFMTLIFPFVYVLLNWREQTPQDRLIRVLVVANVVWTFFCQRVLWSFGASNLSVPVTYALEHILLLCLIVKSYGATKPFFPH